MIYVLMNKNTPILTCEIDEDNANITKILEYHNLEYLPVAVQLKNNTVDTKTLKDWWSSRSIPASRDGLKEALKELNITNRLELLTKGFGMSLSDQYWINPDGKLSWDKYNFFTNDFSKDMGDILFGGKSSGGNLASPDNTSDGWLKKRWKIENGERVLIKGGSNIYKQEPVNEVIVSRILRRFGIPSVQYELILINDEPYSVCKNFITTDTELVPAEHIHNSISKSNSDSDYSHFLKCCDKLGIKGAEKFLNSLLAIDYLVLNTDRHRNNFGVIRDVNTLEFIGFAPIYDTGTSLWHDVHTSRIIPNKDLACKPFYDTWQKQLPLISSFDSIDISKLNDFEDELRDILSQYDLINKERNEVLIKGISERIQKLQRIKLIATAKNSPITKYIN